MHTAIPGRSPKRISERGQAAIVGAVAVAVVAGGVAGVIASSQKAQQRLVAAGVVKAQAQDVNVASLGILAKLFATEQVVQRPFFNKPLRWVSTVAPVGGNRFINYGFTAATPSFFYRTCNPPSLPPGDRAAIFAGGPGTLPGLNLCNMRAGLAGFFASALQSNVDTFQPQNDFAQNRFGVQVRARTVYSPAGEAVVNQARFTLPPPQPYCEGVANPTVVNANQPVTVTISTVRGVQSAQWEAPYFQVANPAGESRVFNFSTGGNYTVWFRVTGIPGASAPQSAGPLVGIPGNPPVARCRVNFTVVELPCRFKTAGYTEAFNYPGHGLDLFGRNFNTTGGVVCFNWPNCNNPGKLAMDIPKVPGFGGAANWNWLPAMCLDPTKQCVNVHLACRCNTPLASMVIHDYNKQTCYPAFIMWRPPGGCFVPETRIQMADGSSRRIDSLREGDLVWNPRRQESSVVRRLYRGLERNPLYEIFAGGATLKVTALHVFETPEGPKQARELDWRGTIRMGNGEWAPIDSLRILGPEDEQWVWNVDLESAGGSPEDHWLISDGIVTGDMVAQNLIKEKRP